MKTEKINLKGKISDEYRNPAIKEIV